MKKNLHIKKLKIRQKISCDIIHYSLLACIARIRTCVHICRVRNTGSFGSKSIARIQCLLNEVELPVDFSLFPREFHFGNTPRSCIFKLIIRIISPLLRCNVERKRKQSVETTNFVIFPLSLTLIEM